MANDELCRHCGCEETCHDDPNLRDKFVCDIFESEFQHHEACPILGCGGDCDVTIAEAIDNKRRQKHYVKAMVNYPRPLILLLPTGSLIWEH